MPSEMAQFLMVLFRIPGYIKALQSKKVDGSAKPEIEEVTPTILRCDAQNGFAPLAHKYGIKNLIDAANAFGIAGLSIQRCHHFAALWPEVEAISDEGLVGLTSVSYTPACCSFGRNNCIIWNKSNSIFMAKTWQKSNCF